MTWTCQKEEIGIPASSRGEEEIDAQICPCGKAIESRNHILGECETCNKERDVLEEELRELNECDMEGFDTLDIISEKTTAILGDRRWRQAAKQEGDKISKNILLYVIYGNNVLSAQMLEVSLFGTGTVLRLVRDARSMVMGLRQAVKAYAPPPVEANQVLALGNSAFSSSLPPPLHFCQGSAWGSSEQTYPSPPPLHTYPAFARDTSITSLLDT